MVEQIWEILENHALKWKNRSIVGDTHVEGVWCGCVHWKQLPPNTQQPETHTRWWGLTRTFLRRRGKSNDGWRRTKQPWDGAPAGVAGAGWPFVYISFGFVEDNYLVRHVASQLLSLSLNRTRSFASCWLSFSGSGESAGSKEEGWEPCWSEDCQAAVAGVVLLILVVLLLLLKLVNIRLYKNISSINILVGSFWSVLFLIRFYLV